VREMNSGAIPVATRLEVGWFVAELAHGWSGTCWKSPRTENGEAVFTIESGSYEFTSLTN
jgi:hypothetical protein